MGTGEITAGVTLQWTRNPSRKEKKIVLVFTSETKIIIRSGQPDGPLG